MVLFRGLEWSISKPAGNVGMGLQMHDGEGHVGVVGKGGEGLRRERVVVKYREVVERRHGEDWRIRGRNWCIGKW